MIRAILIDDEAYVRREVKNKLLNSFSNDVDIVGEADSIVSSVDIIQKEKPDLLFLDVHLQDGTGFDILDKISNKTFDIIFITGFDNHAIKAIKVGALDYILKPIDDEEFNKAVRKAIENSKQNIDFEKLVEISSEYFKGVKKKRIVLKTLENLYIVYEDDISHCKSEGNYTTFYTQKSEKILVSKPLKKVLELLSEDSFIRCHQSYLVNKKHVTRYNKQGVLVMNSKAKVPVSGRRKDYVINTIFQNQR